VLRETEAEICTPYTAPHVLGGHPSRHSSMTAAITAGDHEDQRDGKDTVSCRDPQPSADIQHFSVLWLEKSELMVWDRVCSWVHNLRPHYSFSWPEIVIQSEV
jgi:hypothetical protein